MPLTEDRNTLYREGLEFEAAPAGGQVIWRGAIVCLNAANAVVRGAAATGLRCLGVAQNSTTDQAYAGRIRARRGCFAFANSAAGEALTLSDVGAVCFIADDAQVQKTNPAGNSRSACGIVRWVDAQGVWVEI